MDETPRADAEQATLPFDAALDAPVPYALTARARRLVAPDSLPSLQVLDGPDHLPDHLPEELDDPHDTRAARARALRHAGVDESQIADELGVDLLAVRAWVGDVVPVASARRRLRAVATAASSGDDRAARRRAGDEAFQARRSAARAAAAERITGDPAFVAGLGLLSGVAEVGPHGLHLTTTELPIVRGLLRWLGGTLELDQARVRLLLRLAPQVAGDRAVHDWHRGTGILPERISTTRWRQAPTADAVEATLRVPDPRVAGAVAGWRDALLEVLDRDRDGLDLAW